MAVTVVSTVEDMLFGVQDFVEDTFGTYLTAMQTLKNDGITLTDLKEVAVGDVEVFDRNVSPVMYLFPQNIPIEPLDMGQDEMLIDLEIIISLEGPAKEKLAIKALRYADCFREMVDDDKTLGGSCDYARIRQLNYLGPEPGESQRIAIELIAQVTLTVANR